VASQTISGQRWADGTTVGVYPAAAWPDPSQAPSGSAVATAAVAGGAVTFTGLAENVRYVAYAGGVGVGFVVPQLDPTDTRSLRQRVDELAGDTLPAVAAKTPVYEEGVLVGDRKINLVGGGVAVTDDSANDRVNVRVLDEVAWAHDPRFAGGALGDGVTENRDAEAINAAIQATPTAGGVVGIAPGRDYRIDTAVLAKSRVRLFCPDRPVSRSQQPSTRLRAASVSPYNGPLISGSDSAAVGGFTIEGLALHGTANAGSKGIYGGTAGASDWKIRDVFCNNFGDQAIHLPSGTAGAFHDILIQNSLLIRTGRTGYIGVFDLSVSDAQVHNIEAGASVSGITDGWIAAIVYRGANAFFGNGIVCENSEAGFVLASTASFTRLVGVRADINYGHGFVVSGANSLLDSCLSYRNSLAGDNLYDGFYADGSSTTFAFPYVQRLDSAHRVRYCFNDNGSAGTTNLIANRWIHPRGREYGTGLFNLSGTLPKLIVGWHDDTTPLQVLASAATLTVYGGPRVYSVTGTTTINNISANGMAGVEVTLITAGALTIAHNAGGTGNIRLDGDANKSMTANDVIRLFCDGTLWHQSSPVIVKT
jgi:hypothetical protein